MPRCDKTWFGAVIIDGKQYGDVLIIGNEVIERGKFGWFDTHSVNKRELNELLVGKPEVIVIGSGQGGALEVPFDVEKKIKENGIQLIVCETPRAIEEYNRLSKTKKVNALIHTTC